ncbi:SDR family NAD(P)-dependent oxidoreductase [Massilia sp. PAMC28688]|uniref:SDR family NAD(P)-dependent oxidoreductase n=1 Tax=Massilia sp. PAMC28688 TaxID=2861283 RepID=UPI001C639E26|nr:SDR family NAD(P)-dependent oxidoreductase [Massilia sp. PAMC28688]QYF94666.1 SDR family NAD(P)-dependent oxidoreductase [Massilia sp. PAMC28688]
MLDSLPDQFHALVTGASGALGQAFIQHLAQDPRCASVQGLHRQSHPALDFADEDGIAGAARQLAAGPPLHLIINAAGLLHRADFMPEKRLDDMHYAQLRATFEANTFGPALLLRHFTPLLADGRAIMAMLSARVGSIGDNRLGGWYSYRASKAALNMLVKTAAIEVARSKPASILVALHPGTVASPLSQPFRSAGRARPAHDAARDMLQVLDTLQPQDSGSFRAYDGSCLPW